MAFNAICKLLEHKDLEMACGVSAVTKQRQCLVIISSSVMNKDGLVNPKSHPGKLRWCFLGWSQNITYWWPAPFWLWDKPLPEHRALPGPFRLDRLTKEYDQDFPPPTTRAGATCVVEMKCHLLFLYVISLEVCNLAVKTYSLEFNFWERERWTDTQRHRHTR